MREDAGLERAGQPLLVVLAGPAPLFGGHSVDVRAGECPQDGSGVFAGDPVFAMVRWLRSIQRWWSWRGGVVRDDIAAGPSPRTSWWAPPETHLGSGTSRPAALRRRRAHRPTDRRPTPGATPNRLRTPRQDINRQTAHSQSTATQRLTPDPVPLRLRPPLCVGKCQYADQEHQRRHGQASQGAGRWNGGRGTVRCRHRPGRRKPARSIPWSTSEVAC